MKSIRRVVTGLNADGRSGVVSDSRGVPLTTRARPGYSWHRIWSLDSLPSVPNDGLLRQAAAYAPPPHGLRFTILTIPPDATRHQPPIAAAADPDQGGAPHAAEAAAIGLIFVQDGEVWLELDEGEVHLKAGDTIVQNGVRHAWRNRAARPCTLVVCLVGAQPAAGPPRATDGAGATNAAASRSDAPYAPTAHEA